MVALMMEAARTSEMSVNFYQTTRRYNPDDDHRRTHRRENLKSYLRFIVACPSVFVCVHVVIEWLALLLRIREVPGSNLGPESGYPD
jgi:hypothetical protein